MTDQYESPLSSRYASDYMLHLFSQQKRIETWRKLWISLAKAEHSLGLPITEKQIEELEAHITDIDFACAAAREKEVRHCERQDGGGRDRKRKCKRRGGGKKDRRQEDRGRKNVG